MVGWERPMALALLVLALPVLYRAVRRDDRVKQVAGLLRGLLVALLAVAVAGPTVAVDDAVHREPTLTVLSDESMSTSLLDPVDLQMDGVQTERAVVAGGNSSKLKQGILRHLEPDTNYVVVSDFQDPDGLDGLAERFNEVNATLNAVKPAETEEYAVRVEGPDTTVPGAEVRFTVHVSSTRTPPEPQVELDGEPVELESAGDGRWTFTTTFSGQDTHRIVASLPVDDRYDLNDRYFKAVEVAEKPEILVVGGEGGLGAELERFYDVSYADDVPDDLSDYYAVVLKKDVDGLTRYAMEGNGVVYTGDPDDEALDILPVKVVPGDEQAKGTKIALSIDISVSTAGSGVKQSKQIAYNLVELLPFNNRVGAVAYNREAFLVSTPKPLSLNREKLQDRIARLQPSGPSFHNNGIRGAAAALNGTGNIIWISDGKIGGFGANEDVPQKTRDAAEDLDVRLITIAVGDDANTDFLQRVTDRAGGMFLDASETGRLKFVFRAGGASGEASRLVVVQPDHFITRGTELTGSAAGFDGVAPRRGADLLVTGTGGQPFLTTWRYGLGRVAAFSGGNRELSHVRQADTQLLLRTVSWAVGVPDRKEDRWIDIGDAHQPAPVEVQASHPADGLKRQSDDLYTGELQPGERGFHTFAGETYAYNYNQELARIGTQDVQSVVRQTGGEVYSPDEMDALREQAVQFSSRTVPTKTPRTNYVLMAALLVFLTEVGYRKLNGRL